MSLNFPSSPSNGDTYDNFVYDSTKGAWKLQSVPANVTSQLSDVSSTAPTNNQILIFNDSTGEYEPGNLPENPSPIGLILALG
jgi:hypothetical protein